jgi:2-desacetyl-2-hydroxyethyl bacteriochlorophyllide A dehydrogenase
MTSARTLWVTAAERAEIRAERLPERGEHDLLVRALYSGISRGTERLVYRGRVPASEYQRMRAPHQKGDFPYPVAYGYASVGRVAEGPRAWLGREVFSLYPHQTAYVLPQHDVLPLPPGLPGARAVLAANMETALNALWDAELAAGDRVCVVGAGVVGCLVSYLAARHPGTDVSVLDVDPRRAGLVAQLGARFVTAESAPRDCDVVLHASGAPAGLVSALELAGDEARVIELSWYGDQPVTLPLGADFHVRRLTLRSSQVGRLPPRRAPRWTHRRRLALALELLKDPALDALIGSECPFDDAPARLPALFAELSGELCLRLTYPPA